MIDYDKVIPQKIRDIQPSGIRKFFDIAQQVEEQVRQRFLSNTPSAVAARAAERPVAVSADDFNDED